MIDMNLSAAEVKQKIFSSDHSNDMSFTSCLTIKTSLFGTGQTLWRTRFAFKALKRVLTRFFMFKLKLCVSKAVIEAKLTLHLSA